MPTGVYVRKNAVWDRLKAGMAADHAADFAQWLRERRYTPLTVAERMRLLASWTHWARGQGYTFAAIREAYAVSSTLIEAGHRPRFRGDVNKDAVETVKLFIAYLEERGVLTRLSAKSAAPLVAEFAAWAREQCGLISNGSFAVSMTQRIASVFLICLRFTRRSCASLRPSPMVTKWKPVGWPASSRSGSTTRFCRIPLAAMLAA